ncbi:MAG TPA: hypothetical protein VNL98_05950 [Gemmatimonadales bacterium]|nr:hypothetical protein [Gemmatimonadales bacterium]
MNVAAKGVLRARTALAALLVAALFASATFLWPARPDSQRASGAEAETFLLTADPSVSRLAPELEDARRVTGLQELNEVVDGPAVILVDKSAAVSLSEGSLRQFAAKGYSLIGLNVPLDDLSALAGFTEEISQINPEFGREPIAASFKGDFFTVVWRTPADAEIQRWRRLQQDFTASLFAAVLADQKRRSAGLALNDAGEIIPLEDY